MTRQNIFIVCTFSEYFVYWCILTSKLENSSPHSTLQWTLSSGHNPQNSQHRAQRIIPLYNVDCMHGTVCHNIASADNHPKVGRCMNQALPLAWNMNFLAFVSCVVHMLVLREGIQKRLKFHTYKKVRWDHNFQLFFGVQRIFFCWAWGLNSSIEFSTFFWSLP